MTRTDESELLPIYADGGIGKRLMDAMERSLEDYVYSPDEADDHEPTEWERTLMQDFLYSAFNEEVSAILQEDARATLEHKPDFSAADLLQSALRDQSIANLSGIDESMDIMRHVVEWLRKAADRQRSHATHAVEAPNSQPLVTHIRPARDGDPVCYAWQVCASGEEGAVPVYEDKNGRHIVDMTDISDLRKRIASAIFDPGATEGLKGDRDLTTWQTDAVMRVLGVNIDRIAERSDNG